MIGIIIEKLRDWSINKKLNALVFIICISIGFSMSLIMSLNETYTQKRALIYELHILADLVIANTNAAILFGDAKTAKENISAFKTNPYINQVHVILPNKKIFVSYLRDVPIEQDITLNQAEINHLQQHPSELVNSKLNYSYEMYWDRIDFVKQMEFQGKIIGTLFIQSNLNLLIERVSWNLLIIFISVIASILLALKLSSRLQKLLLKPIFQLLNIMQQVSTREDYTLRCQPSSKDELGQLINEFNSMLTQLDIRDEKLQNYREHLEERVEQRTAELAIARDEALAANKAKSLFLANMSHEIRTPLNAILGYAQILKRDAKLTEEHKKLLVTIEKSGNHLLAIINDILDISKIEAGAVEIRPTTFYLKEFIENIAAIFKIRCEQVKLNWQLSYHGDVETLIVADRNKLQQVLLNLLGNAIKFTEKGKVELQVIVLGEQGYQFEIIDSGLGIESSKLESIFEAFQQEKAGILKGGSGLGLAICKRYIGLMQGTIQVHSELGKGSRFIVTLPYIEPINLPEPANLTIENYQLKSPTQITALVVDDIEDSCQLLHDILTELGIEVQIAHNGAEALLKLRQQLPNIVFMDIQMPVMDGATAMRMIEKEFSANRPVCIAVSASTLEHQIRALLDNGFDNFIAKPFKFETIYRCLENHLNLILEKKIPDESTVALKVSSETLAVNFEHQLPEALYQRLLNALELHDLTELQQAINMLMQTHPQYQVLAHHLKEQLASYDIEGMQETLEHIKHA